MLPLTGLTAACGNVLLRKPKVPPPLSVPVRPRSPLVAVDRLETIVTGAPNVTPWSVDLRTFKLPPLWYQ